LILTAMPGLDTLVAAMLFAYFLCGFFDTLTIDPYTVTRLDQEFVIADGKIEELRHYDETNNGRNGNKIN